MLDQHAERPEQNAGGDMLVQRPAVPFLPLRPGSSPANAVRTRYRSASSRGGANALRNQSALHARIDLLHGLLAFGRVLADCVTGFAEAGAPLL